MIHYSLVYTCHKKAYISVEINMYLFLNSIFRITDYQIQIHFNKPKHFSSMLLRLIPCGECSFTSSQIRFLQKRNTYLDFRTFEDVGTYVCLVTILDNLLADVV